MLQETKTEAASKDHVVVRGPSQLYSAYKLRRNLHDYGLMVSLKKSIAYLAMPVFYRHTWYITRNDLAALANPKRPERLFTFRVLQYNEPQVIDQIQEWEEWLKGKIDLGDNQICTVATSNDGLIGFVLYALAEYDLPNTTVKITLEKKEAWGIHIAVRKPYRRMGLATELRRTAYSDLRERGFRSFYDHVPSDNFASLNLCKKTGSSVSGILRYLHAGNHNKLEYRKTTRANPGEEILSDKLRILSSIGKECLRLNSSEL
jgi:ribosomal protein S18 acetylase RimI-like enzyme